MNFRPYVIALFLVSASAFGGQSPNYPHFVAVKGNHEFTGQMIARPMQFVSLLERGVSPDRAARIRLQTALLVSKEAVQYRPQLDEYILEVPRGSNEDRFAADLMSKGAFQYVEPNWKVFICDPNDPLYPQQWHLPKIHANTAWNMFIGNNSIIVALTDTGIRQDHEDLVAALVPGYNAVQGLTQGQGGDVNDTHGHGTHTAGIAGAVGNNSIGVCGVCQQVHLMPIKVTVGSGGSSSIATLTGGAIWAVDHGARVVSTSFSGFDSSSTVQTTGDYIKHQRNGLYCWAAGNDSRNVTTEWVDVTVCGASDQNDQRASFSAYGTAVDCFAPGVNVLSTYGSASNGYAFLSGTSMATPCTAGVGAMIIMANPSLTGQQVETILYATCDNIGDPNIFGHGRVNLNSALSMVYNTTTFSPSTATVTIGTLTGGGTAQLGAMDNQFMTAQTSPSITANDSVGAVQIQYDTFTTISTIGTMTFTYAGLSSSDNVLETIDLYDWTANAWVTLDQRQAPLTDTAIVLHPTTPNRFKGAGGLIRSRTTYQKFYTTLDRVPYQVSVDQVAFLTTP